ncbi:MAG TPA: BrnA antitoxin family protein [Terriglobales bacterium]|nr:BrnA antitoxin family protein [Terriglobales bacterium]
MVKTSKKQKKIPGKKVTGKKSSGLKASGSAKWSPGMEKLYKPLKKPVTLRLDADVIAWYQNDGRGYQTRINKALRQLMVKEHKGRS